MRYVLAALVLMIAVISTSCSPDSSEHRQDKIDQNFSFEMKINLPGTPEVIFDASTGDISAWWDHSYSEKPLKLYIEPKPGGSFIEIFDEQGNGARHAIVTYAHRGKLLRFEGPLGLAGKAIHMVHTYTYTALGADSTQLHLSVHATGEIEEGVPAIVEKVWHHFLVEQIKPYVESGMYTADN